MGHHLVSESWQLLAARFFLSELVIPLVGWPEPQIPKSPAAHQCGAQRKTAKTDWQGQIVQDLVAIVTNGQALKTHWKCDSFQALVESVAKCQALKTAWKCDCFQALVKFVAKRQGLQTAWKCDSF